MPFSRFSFAAPYGKILSIIIFFTLSLASFYVLESLISTQPLLHDEAVYLTKARSWLAGTPADQWGSYRPIGMSVVAWVLLHFGDSERFFRLFGAFTGALAPPVIFLLFRRICNSFVGIAAALTAALSTLYLEQAPQFLNDIPSSALLILSVYFVYDYYATLGTSRSLYGAIVCAAAAFYLRYGVVNPLVVVAICTTLVLLPRLWREEHSDFSRIGKAILLACVLFAPHFIYSVVATKKLFGVLSSAEHAASHASFGEGFVQYITWLPAQIGGWPLGIAAIVGAVATTVIGLHPPWRERYLGLFWLGSIGLLTFGLTGLFVHAEARYVFFPIVLLAGCGIAALYFLIEPFSKIAARACMIAIIAASAYFGFYYYQAIYNSYWSREASPLTVAYSKVLEAVRVDSNGKGCSLWLAEYLPRASWYTKCNIYRITNDIAFYRDAGEHTDNTYYSIVHEGIEDAQISPQTASEFDVVPVEISRVHLYRGDLVAYRLDIDLSRITSR